MLFPLPQNGSELLVCLHLYWKRYLVVSSLTYSIDPWCSSGKREFKFCLQHYMAKKRWIMSCLLSTIHIRKSGKKIKTSVSSNLIPFISFKNMSNSISWENGTIIRGSDFVWIIQGGEFIRNHTNSYEVVWILTKLYEFVWNIDVIRTEM